MPVLSALCLAASVSDASNIYLQGHPETGIYLQSSVEPMSAASHIVMNLEEFRADSRFSGIDGSGMTIAIIDTGANLNHPYFGDRIVAQYDFGDNDNDATDRNGHGTNVAGIAASSDPIHTGVAPGANLAILKVFTDGGAGTMSMVERALQWVIANEATHQIISINMSISDMGNHNTDASRYGLGDEFQRLVNKRIIPVGAAGNFFYPYNSEEGLGYPAADTNVVSVGATFSGNQGGFTSSSGASARTSDVDRIAPFSQRHETMLDVFAPGVRIVNAGRNGGSATYSGTSMASPQVAGVVALMQQLAVREGLGRLSFQEVLDLLREASVVINDGDDEDDNVVNTGHNFARVDMMKIGEAIWAMAHGDDEVTNLAFGQEARMGRSDWGAGWNPPHAWMTPQRVPALTDGSLDTVVGTWTTSLPFIWLGVDLGDLKTVNTVDLYWHDAEHLAVDYAIETSTDGVAWTVRKTVVGNSQVSTTDSFASVTARYVRVKVTKSWFGHSSNIMYNRVILRELAVYLLPPPANLAFGQEARIGRSDWGDGWNPPHAWMLQQVPALTDGSLDTVVGTWTSSLPFIWLGVDLGDLKTVNTVDLYWHNAQHLAVDYAIETSTDGVAWTVRKAVVGNTQVSTSDLFAPVTARYVRVKVTKSWFGHSSNTMYNRVILRELEVF